MWDNIFHSLEGELLHIFILVNASGGMKPASPTDRIDTRPDGRIVNQVRLAWRNDILSQASGGSCNALKGEINVLYK